MLTHHNCGVVALGLVAPELVPHDVVDLAQPGAADVSLVDFYGDCVRLNEKWACQFSWVGDHVGWLWNAPKPPTDQQALKVARGYELAGLDFARHLAARSVAPVVVVDYFARSAAP